MSGREEHGTSTALTAAPTLLVLVHHHCHLAEKLHWEIGKMLCIFSTFFLQTGESTAEFSSLPLLIMLHRIRCQHTISWSIALYEGCCFLLYSFFLQLSALDWVLAFYWRNCHQWNAPLRKGKREHLVQPAHLMCVGLAIKCCFGKLGEQPAATA